MRLLATTKFCLKTQKMCKHFHNYKLHFVALSIFMQNGRLCCQYLRNRNTFFASNLRCTWRSHTGSLSSDEERKKMAHKVIHTSAKHADFVRDVTDRLPGTKWQRPQAW